MRSAASSVQNFVDPLSHRRYTKCESGTLPSALKQLGCSVSVIMETAISQGTKTREEEEGGRLFDQTGTRLRVCWLTRNVKLIKVVRSDLRPEAFHML